MKKYIVSTDSYSMTGTDGYNTMAYILVNGEQGYVLQPLKQQLGINVMNIENFVGGGESVEYDIIEIQESYDVCATMVRKKGEKYECTVSIDKNAEGEQIELLYLEAAKNTFFKDVNEDNISYSVCFNLAISDTLEGLNEFLGENDFAKRFISEGDALKDTKKYFEATNLDSTFMDLWGLIDSKSSDSKIEIKLSIFNIDGGFHSESYQIDSLSKLDLKELSNCDKVDLIFKEEQITIFENKKFSEEFLKRCTISQLTLSAL